MMAVMIMMMGMMRAMMMMSVVIPMVMVMVQASATAALPGFKLFGACPSQHAERILHSAISCAVSEKSTKS